MCVEDIPQSWIFHILKIQLHKRYSVLEKDQSATAFSHGALGSSSILRNERLMYGKIHNAVYRGTAKPRFAVMNIRRQLLRIVSPWK